MSTRRNSTLLDRSLTTKGAIAVLTLLLLGLGLVFAAFGTPDSPGRGDLVPAGAESAQAAELQAEFPGGDTAPLIAVVTRTDAGTLTEADLGEMGDVGDTLAAVTAAPAQGPMVSEDGRAALLQSPAPADLDTDAGRELVDDARAAVSAELPGGLQASMTGGPAFAADIAGAFDGADFLLLGVTVGIVALLLLITYRSPILWLIPLAVVATADRLATVLTEWAGVTFGFGFDAGIVSVLVFGAGTNYALLLISRYREQLRLEPDHRDALAAAVRKAIPAILASNATVVLALGTLLATAVPVTRGIGIAGAIGLLAALLVTIVALPAALALCGRRVFWPFVPEAAAGESAAGATPEHASPEHAAPEHRGAWYRIAAGVVRRPVAVSVAMLALLGTMAAGLATVDVGLGQSEQFRVASESADGLETIGEHFPAGAAAPGMILVPAADAAAVEQAVAGLPGVDRVSPSGEATIDGTAWARLSVSQHAAPATAESAETVEAMRTAAHPIAPGALVGGQDAEALDAREAARNDLLVAVPLILGVILVVLLVFLRSVVAPLVLMALNVLSAAAAIGAGTVVSSQLLGFSALDVSVPLIAFLFLVALGIDYTIFLAHRAKEETSETIDVRAGIVRAVGSTGVVISSAGVVLAAVFAALGVLPLVTLLQIGLIVCIGVLLDTLLVRTLAVPAVFALLGDRIWWPAQTNRSETGRAVRRDSYSVTDTRPAAGADNGEFSATYDRRAAASAR